MTGVINGLLLKYKRGAACLGPGASHRTVVVTLTYHHQQIIILGQHIHRHHHRTPPWETQAGQRRLAEWERNVCVALAYLP